MRRILLILSSAVMAYLLLSCKKHNEPVIVPSYANTVIYKNYLALGDSYTIGQSVSDADRFPAQTINMVSNDSIKFNAVEYIATTGWTTHDLLNAVSTAPPSKTTYDFVTLLIGVNNQYQGRSQAEYAAEFITLLAKAIQYAGNKPSHVAVLSIPDWSVTPFAAGSNRALIASQIDSFNVINKQLSLSKSVNYIDITPSSRMAATDPSLIATDGLHPSAKEYNKWAVLLAAVMRSNL